MIRAIKKFYSNTKLWKENNNNYEDEYTPITFTHTFHKEYPRFPSKRLIKPKLLSSFEKLLSTRLSHRDFVQKPLSIKELTKVLYSCRTVKYSGDIERRTYPSAGARFPIEIYVVAFNVNNLEKGVYHYNIKHFSLEQIWKTNLKLREKEIVSPHLHNTAVAIIFTSVISRSEIKYGIRAYPYSLIESGHMAQNIQLVCATLNIGCCPVGGFVNDSVSKILDLTKEEIPLYVIGIGKRDRSCI